MQSEIADPVVAAGGHPVLQVLVSFPIACFTCALLTDITYAVTANMMWSDFSDWLLAAGMAGGVGAAIVGLASLVTRRRTWSGRSVFAAAIGGLLVLATGLWDNLVHTHDAWTSVMPTGLALSAVTVLLILATVWLSAEPRRMRAVAPSYRSVRS